MKEFLVYMVALIIAFSAGFAWGWDTADRGGCQMVVIHDTIAPGCVLRPSMASDSSIVWVLETDTVK